MRNIFTASYFLGICSIAAGKCVDITLKTDVGAYNNYVNIYGDTSLETTILGFLKNVSDGETAFSAKKQYIKGSYDVAGQFCEPSRIVRDLPRTVQLLVHGLGYNRAYWSGLDPVFVSKNGSSYSWVDYATSQGYYTLAIDRVGSGSSSRPDPINALQSPLEVEALHSVISQLRKGTSFASAFGHVVYVGHSYGSALANHLAATHPDDADDYVLTGWSAQEPILKGCPCLTTLLPASKISKAFTGLAAGYMAATTVDAVEGPLYAGGYDPTMPRLDYAVEDTTALGQLVSNNGFENATDFHGGVFVVTGQLDQITCSGNCSKENPVAEALDFFPSAKEKSYLLIPQTGHDINLHYSAPSAWTQVHQWLEKRL
jgi:pimeloyl-ACP methyl ester carboxylesterase